MFIKIRSWHVVRDYVNADDPTITTTIRTLCGRYTEGTPTDSFGDEKTCESCLRIKALRH